MAEAKDKKLINALLFTDLRTRLNLVLKHGFKADYLSRAIFMLADSLIISPFNFLETLIYGKKINNTEILQAPVFILGHWRSGTTHLHNLLSLDSQFAYYRTFDAIFPKASIVLACIESLIDLLLPKTRKIDNVSLSTESPQEEEFGIARLTEMSFYHCFTYPNKMGDFFDRYTLLNGLNEIQKESLKKIIKFLVQKICFLNPSKTALLKNPINTARIKLLLEIFPEAKFIYIERNPYELFESTKNMFSKVQAVSKLEDTSDKELDEFIFSQYTNLLAAYEAQKTLVPSQNLVELQFQNLVENPISTIEKIYKRIDLTLSDNFRKNLIDYLASLKSYKRNEFYLTPEIKARIESEWVKPCLMNH
jgi:hypothetical protein